MDNVQQRRSVKYTLGRKLHKVCYAVVLTVLSILGLLARVSRLLLALSILST